MGCHETKAGRDARIDAALAKVTAQKGENRRTTELDGPSGPSKRVTQEQAAKEAGAASGR